MDGLYDVNMRSLACSMKNVKKTDIYWGSYHINIFIFLTPLQIFVPRLEILFCITPSVPKKPDFYSVFCGHKKPDFIIKSLFMNNLNPSESSF